MDGMNSILSTNTMSIRDNIRLKGGNPKTNAKMPSEIQAQFPAPSPYMTTAIRMIQMRTPIPAYPAVKSTRMITRMAAQPGRALRKLKSGRFILLLNLCVDQFVGINYRDRFSMTPAAPIPPPMHMVQIPYRTPRRFIS